MLHRNIANLAAIGLLAAIPASCKGQLSFFKDDTQPRAALGDVGEPLYLTPYIDIGDTATGRDLALVTDPLEGLGGLQPDCYSGYITVDSSTESHMFFWFFPASEVDPSTAPLVMWLQGGPGSSSMLGLFEINGPISAIDNGAGGVTAEVNPYSWHKEASMFHTFAEGFVTNQDEMARDLFEFLNQWFQLFPEYLQNDFYAFGESYAGKYVPAISLKIHQENQNGGSTMINLKGLGIGNGAISPTDSYIYADFLYQAGLITEIDRDEFLDLEKEFRDLVEAEQWAEAQLVSGTELSEAMYRIGCPYAMDLRQCFVDPEESNYADYVNLDSTRVAAHTGSIEFAGQSDRVYAELFEDIPKTVRPRLEELLENDYKVLIYNGNMDIICHHTGNVVMLENLNWSGVDDYLNSENKVYTVNGNTAGYVTNSDNLWLFVMRNAGHMVPRSQPSNAYEMFNDFLKENL